MDTALTALHAARTAPLGRAPKAVEPVDGAARLALLQRAFVSAPLTPAAADAMAGLAQEHRVRAGDTVLSRSEMARGLWLVASGRVTVGGWEADRQWRQTHSVVDGEWLDAASAWLGDTFQEDAIAETDTVLLQFPLPAVKRACNSHASLSRALLALLALRVRQLTENTHGLLSKDVLARCADWLLSSMDANAGTVRLTQRKRSIASQLGATPETFSRTLRQLREKGTIEVDGYSIVVRDVPALRRMASKHSVETPAS
jgi:CRP-like cAMP-binding protein